MYFYNRAQAGRLLATRLEGKRNANPVVVALSPGAVILGAQIAMKIHANLVLLMTEDIYLPGERQALASLSSVGFFAYNNMYSAGQIEDLTSEYRHFIDQKRFEKLHELNRLMGKDGEIHKEHLRNHTVILVSDGLSNGFSIDIAVQSLKSIAVKQMVAAVPLASVDAVDRMHLLCDEIFCLSVVQNYMNTDHYYEDNTIPPISDLLKVIRNIPLYWNHPRAKS